MKSIVLTRVGQVELRDIPKPALAAETDVLLKTSVAGLCGSDLHYFTTEAIAGECVPLPAVLGHEVSAIVEAVGPRVTRLKPGDRVVSIRPYPAALRSTPLGNAHTCRKLRFLGSPGEWSGALAEFFVMPEANCFLVPEGITMREAMLVEPFSIALHALSFWQAAQPQPGGVGSGPDRPLGHPRLPGGGDREDQTPPTPFPSEPRRP